MKKNPEQFAELKIVGQREGFSCDLGAAGGKDCVGKRNKCGGLDNVKKGRYGGGCKSQKVQGRINQEQMRQNIRNNIKSRIKTQQHYGQSDNSIHTKGNILTAFNPQFYRQLKTNHQKKRLITEDRQNTENPKTTKHRNHDQLNLLEIMPKNISNKISKLDTQPTQSQNYKGKQQYISKQSHKKKQGEELDKMFNSVTFSVLMEKELEEREQQQQKKLQVLSQQKKQRKIKQKTMLKEQKISKFGKDQKQSRKPQQKQNSTHKQSPKNQQKSFNKIIQGQIQYGLDLSKMSPRILNKLLNLKRVNTDQYTQIAHPKIIRINTQKHKLIQRLRTLQTKPHRPTPQPKHQIQKTMNPEALQLQKMQQQNNLSKDTMMIKSLGNSKLKTTKSFAKVEPPKKIFCRKFTEFYECSPRKIVSPRKGLVMTQSCLPIYHRNPDPHHASNQSINRKINLNINHATNIKNTQFFSGWQHQNQFVYGEDDFFMVEKFI